MSIERDRCRLVAGVRHGRTLGSPICVIVENADHQNWLDSMSPEPVDNASGTVQPLTVPRPGHADLAGVAKYGTADIRDILERASARETVARVAGGAICKRLLGEVGVVVRSRVTSIGSVVSSAASDFSDPESVDWQTAEDSPVGCDDEAAGVAMCAAIDEARAAGDSLGGVFEIWCWGVCPGLGSHVSAESRLDGRLLGALASIPAIKGVEIGMAFANAQVRGSEVHDPFIPTKTGTQPWISRTTNRAGGLEGGMSTGMPIIIRAAMKPIPTLTAALPSVDLSTMLPTRAHVERSDVCAVPAARVVGEAMLAYVVAACYVEKFGSDSLADLVQAVRDYETRLENRGLWHRS
jgi:chorismate synthase